MSPGVCLADSVRKATAHDKADEDIKEIAKEYVQRPGSSNFTGWFVDHIHHDLGEIQAPRGENRMLDNFQEPANCIVT